MAKWPEAINDVENLNGLINTENTINDLVMSANQWLYPVWPMYPARMLGEEELINKWLGLV